MRRRTSHAPAARQPTSVISDHMRRTRLAFGLFGLGLALLAACGGPPPPAAPPTVNAPSPTSVPPTVVEPPTLVLPTPSPTALGRQSDDPTAVVVFADSSLGA